MKKVAKKPLSLPRETIRQLTTLEHRSVHGGAPKTEKTCSCTDNPIISCCP